MRPSRAEPVPTSSSTKNALPSARVDDVAHALLRRTARCCSWATRRRTSAARQRLELDPLDAGHPGPDGDLAAERVTAVEVVGAVGGDQGDRRVEAAAEQEAHQVAGRLVGPVEVLDDEQQRAGGSRRPRRGRGRRRAARPGRRGRTRGRSAWLSIRWPGSSRSRAGWRLGDVVEEVGQLAGDPAGDLGEGEVGQGAVGEVEAVAGEHLPAARRRPGRGARSGGGSCRRRRRRRAGRPIRSWAGRAVPDAEMPSVEQRCSSSASRPTSSDVMWSILSWTTDADISVDPVLLVGDRAAPSALRGGGATGGSAPA